MLMLTAQQEIELIAEIYLHNLQPLQAPLGIIRYETDEGEEITYQPSSYSDEVKEKFKFIAQETVRFVRDLLTLQCSFSDACDELAELLFRELFVTVGDDCQKGVITGLARTFSHVMSNDRVNIINEAGCILNFEKRTGISTVIEYNPHNVMRIEEGENADGVFEILDDDSNDTPTEIPPAVQYSKASRSTNDPEASCSQWQPQASCSQWIPEDSHSQKIEESGDTSSQQQSGQSESSVLQQQSGLSEVSESQQPGPSVDSALQLGGPGDTESQQQSELSEVSESQQPGPFVDSALQLGEPGDTESQQPGSFDDSKFQQQLKESGNTESQQQSGESESSESQQSGESESSESQQPGVSVQRRRPSKSVVSQIHEDPLALEIIPCEDSESSSDSLLHNLPKRRKL